MKTSPDKQAAALVVKTTVQPPPTKKELIEAMTLVQQKENRAFNDKAKLEAGELSEALACQIFDNLKGVIPVLSVGYQNTELHIDVSRLLTKAQKKTVALIKSKRDARAVTNIDDLRKLITERMNGILPGRIQKLVDENEPELKKMLAAIK